MSWTLRWLVAYCFTHLVEMGVYVNALEKSANGSERPMRERLAIAFGASAITHPLVWFAIPDACYELGLSHWWTIVAIAEAFALIAETLWLAAFGVRRAFVWSFVANGSSYLVGLFCYLILDW